MSGIRLAFIERYTNLQETPGQFLERCGQVALACFWKEHHPTANGSSPASTRSLVQLLPAACTVRSDSADRNEPACP